MPKTLQGRFRPRNPDKYKGDAGNIFYRSSWERAFMRWADSNDNILAWQSEEKVVWYYDPIAKKKRRYFPDFIIKYKNKDGIIMTEMIEVKPQAQVDGPPTNPKRRTAAWARAVQTYITNQAKWEAACKYCEDKGMSFRLITEKHLKM